MTDRALSWVDEEKLASRVLRQGDPDWDELLKTIETHEVTPLLDNGLRIGGSHVRRS